MPVQSLTDDSPAAFVAGEPALLLSRGESAWRDAVRSCGVTGLVDVRLRFVVRSWHRAGNRFDLDNLVDPVLGVVAAVPPLRHSTWATVETGDAPGVEISATAPPPAPPDATTVHIASVPLRSVRTTEREQRRIYDRRRDEMIPQHGLRLWVIQPDDVGGNARGRLDRRDHERDLALLRSAWSAFERDV